MPPILIPLPWIAVLQNIQPLQTNLLEIVFSLVVRIYWHALWCAAWSLSRIFCRLRQVYQLELKLRWGVDRVDLHRAILPRCWCFGDHLIEDTISCVKLHGSCRTGGCVGAYRERSSIWSVVDWLPCVFCCLDLPSFHAWAMCRKLGLVVAEPDLLFPEFKR